MIIAICSILGVGVIYTMNLLIPRSSDIFSQWQETSECPLYCEQDIAQAYQQALHK